MLNVGPGLESDTGMTVLVVGPTEEPLAERLGVLEAGEGAFGRRLLYEPKPAPMTTLFRNSSDKRLVVFRGAFGGRPVKEGVTLTDDGRLRATFGFLGPRHSARERRPSSHHPGSIAGGWRPAPGAR